MENNIFELLSQLMGRNSQNIPQQPQPNPYYPSEAYPEPNTQNINNNNNLLPMLMSLMGGGNSANALGKMMGLDNNVLSNLLKPQQKSSPQSDEQEHIIPSDDILL